MFYRVTAQSENEGSRSFVFEPSEEEKAEAVAAQIVDDLGEGWRLVACEPLSLGDAIMELCTY